MDTTKPECAVWGDSHIHVFDQRYSGPHMSLFMCACGATIEEYEDAGTGA